MAKYRIEAAGMDAVTVRAEGIDIGDIQAYLLALQQHLNGQDIAWLLETVLAESCLTVFYDCSTHSHQQIKQCLSAIFDAAPALNACQTQDKAILLPAYYDQHYGVDLEPLSRRLGLSISDIIELHCNAQYKVASIGFAPGFAYLVGLPQTLQLPRRDTPRTCLPAGSIAIANQYSAVYPQASPGGWHIIGNCPLNLFNPGVKPPIPFTVGAPVRFRQIDKAEFEHLAQNPGGSQWQH